MASNSEPSLFGIHAVFEDVGCWVSRYFYGSWIPKSFSYWFTNYFYCWFSITFSMCIEVLVFFLIVGLIPSNWTKKIMPNMTSRVNNLLFPDIDDVFDD